MSEDQPAKKLKLSRASKVDETDPQTDQPKEQEVTPSPNPTPAPSMQLRRTPTPPEEPKAEKRPEPEVSSTPPAPAESPAQNEAEDFDPENPFGDIIKEGEIKARTGPPPELPSKPVPTVDDGSGQKVEDAINNLDQTDAEADENDSNQSQKSSVVTSIVVILILIGILAGASYGLWIVLNKSGAQESTDSSESAESKGPIGKAEDVVATVNSSNADADALINSMTGASQEDGASDKDAKSSSQQPVGDNSLQQDVTSYLSSVHIGGMREGQRPMVMLDGVTYQKGDLVQEETGLRFDGFRNGKIAFRDQNGIVYLKSF